MRVMKRTEGRIGESNEFVEFEPRIAVIAQKGSGGFWFVYKATWHTVTTLGQYDTKEEAVSKALEIAEGL